jgi:anti-sigma-K factor RskA
MPEMDVSENVLLQRLTDPAEHACMKRLISERNFWKWFSVAIAIASGVVLLLSRSL